MSKESLFRAAQVGAISLALATACSSTPKESTQTDTPPVIPSESTCSNYPILLPVEGSTVFGDKNRQFEASEMSPGLYEVKLVDGIGTSGDGVIQRIEGIPGAHIVFLDDGGVAEIRVESLDIIGSLATVTDCLFTVNQPA